MDIFKVNNSVFLLYLIYIFLYTLDITVIALDVELLRNGLLAAQTYDYLDRHFHKYERNILYLSACPLVESR